MADYDSSLPIRTEAAGDVDIFVSDATTPSQKLKVNADGSIDTSFAPGAQIEITDGTETLLVNVDGSINSVVSATDLDIRDLVFATDAVDVSGSEVSLDATTLAALENVVVSATDLDIRDLVFATDKVDASGSEVSLDAATLAALESVTVSATDLDIRDMTAVSDKIAIQDTAGDELGINVDGSINVNVTPVANTKVVDYNTTAALAKDASVNHDYTVSGGVTFTGEELFASASGRIKVEVLVNGAAVFTAFSSTASPNVRIPLDSVVQAAAAQVVRITITNKDKAGMDVYSTLTGSEA